MRPRIGLAAAENPALLPGKHIINTPYIDAIFAAGGTPVLVPVGGGPERARDYMELLALALERHLPVLGICRGMQLVAAALAGRSTRTCQPSGPALSPIVRTAPSAPS